MTPSSKQDKPPSKEPLLPSATPFVLPLLLFLVIVSFYPDFAGSYELNDDGTVASGSTVTKETWQYLVMIAAQIGLAFCLLVYFRNIYFQHFPIRVSWLSIAVGIVGVIVWVLVCQMQLESQLLTWIGVDASRPAFNPFTIPDGKVRIIFFGLRFVLLALTVPIIEELFLRGWLIRWVEDPDWEKVGLKELSWKALLTPCVYGVLTHPAEAIAAVLWFGLVTWLMNRTGNFWDCVVAHAVTNLLLGLYVVQFEQWQLW